MPQTDDPTVAFFPRPASAVPVRTASIVQQSSSAKHPPFIGQFLVGVLAALAATRLVQKRVTTVVTHADGSQETVEVKSC